LVVVVAVDDGGAILRNVLFVYDSYVPEEEIGGVP